MKTRKFQLIIIYLSLAGLIAMQVFLMISCTKEGEAEPVDTTFHHSVAGRFHVTHGDTNWW